MLCLHHIIAIWTLIENTAFNFTNYDDKHVKSLFVKKRQNMQVNSNLICYFAAVNVKGKCIFLINLNLKSSVILGKCYKMFNVYKMYIKMI